MNEILLWKCVELGICQLQLSQSGKRKRKPEGED